MKLNKVSWIPTVILGALAVGPFIVEFFERKGYGPECLVFPIVAVILYLTLSIFGKGKE